MKNLIKLMVIGMVIGFVLVGCNNEDEANETSDNEVNEDSTEVSETTDEEGNNDASSEETKDLEEENTAEEDSGNDGQDVLGLGETGKVESTIGDYEVTVNSFEVHEEFDGEDSLMEVLVLANISIKNTGNEVLNAEELYKADLFNDRETNQGNQPASLFESVKGLSGEIEAGETVEGQLIFDQDQSEYYELIFNYGLSTVATELTWRFDADEASNAE